MSTRDAASTGTRKCYHCGQGGHMAKDCAQAPKAGKTDAAPAKHAASSAASSRAAAATPAAPAAASSSSESAGTRKCYHCGLSGHMAKDCSQAPKDGRSARPSGSAAAGKPAKEKDEKTFKERLAEYKASVPEGAKKNFCYLCGKEGHRERDCPKNSKKKDEDRVCLRCGDPTHIARICPTIANRTVYRQETKPREKGCYICEQEGHHAEECPQLEALSEEFDKFIAKIEGGMKLSAKVYDILLEKCAKALELNGALYLYEQMLARNIDPTDQTKAHLISLHDRSAKDHSVIKSIPMRPKRVARLKQIVSGWRHESRAATASNQFVPAIVAWLKEHASHRSAAEKSPSLFELAKLLRSGAEGGKGGLADTLSSAAARAGLAALKALGRYQQKNKGAQFDLEGDLDQPGKLRKSDNGEATSTKKKKSKKKNKKSASTKKDGATDADGDAEMAAASSGGDDDDEKPAAKKQPKAKSAKKPAAASAAAAVAAETESKPKASKRKAAAAAAAEDEAAEDAPEKEETKPAAAKKQKVSKAPKEDTAAAPATTKRKAKA